MDSYAFLPLLIALIGISAFFSASEMAMTSSNRIRIKNHVEHSEKRAKKALVLIEEFDKTMSIILICKNVTNITTASISTYFSVGLWGFNGVWISILIITTFALIFSEIVPKNSTKKYADKFLLSIVDVLYFVVKVLSPLSVVFIGIEGIISRPVPDEEKRPSITEEELKNIIEEIQDEGVLEEQEGELAQSALDFDDIKVSEILTPRVDVVALDINMTIPEMRDVILEEKYTRLPVYENSIDNIIGIIHEKDFLASLVLGKEFKVRSIMNEAIFIPDNLKISKALAALQKNKMQLAIVTDQHGGTVGIVTMEDILEELVGEIWDEHDEVLQLIETISTNLYKVNGNMDIDDLLKAIGYEGDEIESSYNSVGGWVFEVLDKIPQPGESFEFNNLKVTVDEVDDNRVSWLRVEYIAE